MIIKKFYKFLHKHTIGTIRILYLAPIIALLTNSEHFFKFIVVLCCVTNITIQVGHDKGWYKEDEH